MVKNLQCRRLGFNPWRREWQPTPVFLPGEFHEERNAAGYSPWGCKESDTTERLTHTHSGSQEDPLPFVTFLPSWSHTHSFSSHSWALRLHWVLELPKYTAQELVDSRFSGANTYNHQLSPLRWLLREKRMQNAASAQRKVWGTLWWGRSAKSRRSRRAVLKQDGDSEHPGQVPPPPCSRICPFPPSLVSLTQDANLTSPCASPLLS